MTDKQAKRAAREILRKLNATSATFNQKVDMLAAWLKALSVTR